MSSDLPDFDANCEVIWANLHFAGSKSLIFASYYGPQTYKTAALEELASSVSKIINKNRKTQPNLIIAGDFNYPDIDWSSWKTIKASTASVHCRFLSFLHENSLAQLQHKVTRPQSNSVLDLIVTSCPQLINNIDVLHVLPGISDHDLILFNINMKPKFQPKPSRKICSFQKANLDVLREETTDFSNNFLHITTNNCTVNSN